MCGIFGYKWTAHDVVYTLLEWLQRLEYRWYDSAWIICFGPDNVVLKKATWRVEWLTTQLRDHKYWSTLVSGIAHTRWATHGWVTEENCHPHVSNDGRFYIVHNGIIENYRKLKTELEADWYTFYGQTDTEVIGNLLQKHRTGDLVETVQDITKRIRGAYALLIVCTDNPNHMVWVRLWSPLLLWYTGTEYFVSSDAQAMSWFAEKVIYLEDWDLVSIQWERFLLLSGWTPVRRKIEELDQERLQASKWTYKHFMLKEIFEQPAITSRIFMGRINFEEYTLTADAFHGMQHKRFHDVQFFACGTSYYSSLLGALWFQNIAKIPAKAIIASEAENTPSFLQEESLCVFVSQSWETADTIEVLKQVLDEWWKTFGIVNVPWSSIARLTHSWFFTRAWTEIWVASTKAFLGQAICMVMVSLFLWKQQWMRRSHYKQIIQELEHLPMYIDTVLWQSEYIRSLAEQLAWFTRFFFLWRGYQLPIAYESALKLKEISYQFAQGYPAWELKHGPLALIDEQTPTIFFMPADEHFEKNISSMHEVQARWWKVLVISDKKVTWADRHILIPSTVPELSPLITVVVWQLLAYHIADILWHDIDKPRNLAKSVTVK